MKTKIARNRLATGWLALVCSLLLLAVATAHTAPNELPPSTSSNETNAAELLRSNLQLQEQLHRVQLSIEANREQSDAVAVKAAQSIANRLVALEQTLASDRVRDIDAVRSSTRVLWIVACTFGIIGVLAMLLMAYQWRTVSRLAQVGLPSGPIYPSGSPALTGFETDERRLLSNGTVERSNTQLISALELLEKRIKDLERTNGSANHTVNSTLHAHPALLAGTVAEPLVTNSSNQNRPTVLLGKGQSLLNLDQNEDALSCFDEVLSIEPNNTDAMLKKATALERLRKWPEAIDVYDKALRIDGSIILAYLHKGGLLNRMEKYDEALECYEQALRTQEKR